jgi:uncharacterized membrane protein
MTSNSSAIAVFPSHVQAEEAIKELQKSGFDMTKLSIVAKNFQTEEHVVGYYNLGDRAASWGRFGAFWGWIWGLLFGSAFLFIPGVGPVMIGGPIVSWLIAALETSVVAGGVSALGGALMTLGIPKDSVLAYETAIKNDKFLVVAHGTREQVEKARSILANNNGAEVSVHDQLVAAGAIT